MKRIKNILKHILIFVNIIQYQLLIKILGVKFCINSLKNGFFNLKINPRELLESLNSKFMRFSKPSCLVKSLTFKKLTRNSNEFILIIGVTKINGVFESHAWIEKDNKIILNSVPNISSFKKIFTYE